MVCLVSCAFLGNPGGPEPRGDPNWPPPATWTGGFPRGRSTAEAAPDSADVVICTQDAYIRATARWPTTRRLRRWCIPQSIPAVLTFVGAAQRHWYLAHSGKHESRNRFAPTQSGRCPKSMLSRLPL